MEDEGVPWWPRWTSVAAGDPRRPVRLRGSVRAGDAAAMLSPQRDRMRLGSLGHVGHLGVGGCPVWRAAGEWIPEWPRVSLGGWWQRDSRAPWPSHVRSQGRMAPTIRAGLLVRRLTKVILGLSGFGTSASARNGGSCRCLEQAGEVLAAFYRVGVSRAQHLLVDRQRALEEWSCRD
jgi:hypothetical protein